MLHQHSRQQFSTHSEGTTAATVTVSDTPTATQVESKESSSSSVLPQLSPLLSTWYSLTRHISISDILPVGLGNTNELPHHNAFFGDKRLNLHISLVLRSRTRSAYDTAANDSSSSSSSSSHNSGHRSPQLPPVGTVTDIQSIAMSNQLMASHISQILPHHMTTTTTTFGNIGMILQKNSQIQDAGTMIQAAVDHVSNHTPTASAETIDTALNELAQFLIAKATTPQIHPPPTDDRTNDDDDDDNDKTDDFHQTSTFMTTDLHNPQSEVLRHGGTVTCRRWERGPAPRFTATARMIDLSTTVHHGRNQRDTEQSAAAMLWTYYSKRVLSKTNPSTTTPAGRSSDDDIEEMENPKGRILSIGGTVTREKLPGYPDHLPRFRAVCQKQFFTIPNDDDTSPTKYMMDATAEGRTRYEAERIASAIVWQHVMNMTKIPTPDDDDDDDESEQKLTTDGTNDINVKKKPSKEAVSKRKTIWTEEENDTIFDNVSDPQVTKPFKSKRSAKEQIRQLDQDGFVQFQLNEPPYINLRPGGETVVESWYRGALNPIAAFHRALIAPHVFPNHVGTVNIYTRQNDIVPDDGRNVVTANEELFTGHRQETNTESDTTAAQTESNDSVSDIAATTSICSLNGTDATKSLDDPRIEPTILRDPKYQRTFTVLALVVPNTNHPLIADMTLADFNTNELLTKCFVEHGYNVRQARSTIGLKVNQYIIDTFLRNYENLDELLEKEEKRTELRKDGLTKAERQNIFFKF